MISKNNKKNIISILLFLFFLTTIFFVALPTFADTIQYEPLSPLPGTVGSGGKTTLSTYVPGLIKLIIGVAGALAVIYIVLGGIQYMSTDAISGKEEGKEKINNALLGLLLAITSFVILNTINPNLVNLKLNISKPNIATSTDPATQTLKPCAGTCKDLNPSLFPYKDCGTPKPCKLNNYLVNKLEALNNQLKSVGISWQVTESYPPTYYGHKSSCHYNGNCVDAAIRTSGIPSAEDVRKFLAEVANVNVSQGGKFNGFVYEVSSTDRRAMLLASGFFTPDVIVYNPGSTGEHAHINN